MEITKEIQKMNKDDFIVFYDFNSFYPSAQIDTNSIWPRTATAYSFKKFMTDAVCTLFKSGRWNELNRCSFLTVKYNSPDNLVFQHLPVKEKTNSPY